MESMDSRSVSQQTLKPQRVHLDDIHSRFPPLTYREMPAMYAHIPRSGRNAPVPFKTFIAEGTTENLLLESFYDDFLKNRAPRGRGFPRQVSSVLGVSEFVFENSSGPTTKIKALGVTLVQFSYEGHEFLTTFIIVDNLFEVHELEHHYPAVLGTRFLIESQIDKVNLKDGWKPNLPPAIDFPIGCLTVHTDGCCLYRDQINSEDTKKSIARAGFGVHYPKLPRGWDFCGELLEEGPQTNQRAELVAVIRVLWHARMRCLKINMIKICTDSNYVVKGFNDLMPQWRTSGFRNTKKKEVVNTDLWKEIDRAIFFLRKEVEFCHIEREDNQVADGLAKEAATKAMERS